MTNETDAVEATATVGGSLLEAVVMRDGYKDRVIQHSLKWVNGKPEHNRIDNECVADFSCCYPELFTKDQEKRMRSHSLLIEKLRSA